MLKYSPESLIYVLEINFYNEGIICYVTIRSFLDIPQKSISVYIRFLRKLFTLSKSRYVGDEAHILICVD
jgi:hypothetical protein